MKCDHAPITGHQPIPEDEDHCFCDNRVLTIRTREGSYEQTCPCPCHAPAWSDDASVPDLIEDPLD
jgi:hypothetical protein